MEGATTISPDATPPSYLSKLGGGGQPGREGVLAARPGGVPRGGGGCVRPTTTTCIPQGGVCVWGHGSIEVCMR